MPEAGKIVDMSAEKKARQIDPVTMDGPGKETFLYFLGEIMAAEDAIEAACKTPKEKLKTVKRAAKDHGIDIGSLNIVKKMLTKEMDETPERRAKTIAMYSQWSGIFPRGFQLELDLPAKAPANDKLEEQGYRLGMMGKNLPYEEGTDAWQAAMVGWNKGQDVRKAEFKNAAKPKKVNPKAKAKA